MNRRLFWIVLVSAGASLVSLTAQGAETREAASREGVARDWMLQDYMSVALPESLEREKQQWRDEHLKRPESKQDAPVLATNLGATVAEGAAGVLTTALLEVTDDPHFSQIKGIKTRWPTR